MFAYYGGRFCVECEMLSLTLRFKNSGKKQIGKNDLNVYDEGVLEDGVNT